MHVDAERAFFIRVVAEQKEPDKWPFWKRYVVKHKYYRTNYEMISNETVQKGKIGLSIFRYIRKIDSVLNKSFHIDGFVIRCER